jgi:hypothetical protein
LKDHDTSTGFNKREHSVNKKVVLRIQNIIAKQGLSGGCYQWEGKSGGKGKEV